MMQVIFACKFINCRI